MNHILLEFECEPFANVCQDLLWCFCSRFKNRPDMSFDDVGMEADQEFEIMQDNTGTLEYPLKYRNLYQFNVN